MKQKFKKKHKKLNLKSSLSLHSVPSQYQTLFLIVAAVAFVGADGVGLPWEKK